MFDDCYEDTTYTKYLFSTGTLNDDSFNETSDDIDDETSLSHWSFDSESD